MVVESSKPDRCDHTLFLTTYLCIHSHVEYLCILLQNEKVQDYTIGTEKIQNIWYKQ